MSQTAMELLRMETELDFWPSLLNGHRHQVSSAGCPHEQPATMTTTTTTTTSDTSPNNATSCPSSHPSEGHHHHHHHEKGSKCPNEKKTIAGYSRTPHSYCKFISKIIKSLKKKNTWKFNANFKPFASFATDTALRLNLSASSHSFSYLYNFCKTMKQK